MHAFSLLNKLVKHEITFNYKFYIDKESKSIILN